MKTKKLKLLTVDKDRKGILKQRLIQVKDPKSMKETLARMVEIMYENKGVGLCANQVGLLDRMFVYQTRSGRVEYAINPELIKSSKRTSQSMEGCLSYPNSQVSVSRSVEIKVRYHNGHSVVVKNLKGMEARIWLHEYDHCEGECINGKED